MEFGFYHPARGYWQAIGGDFDDLLVGYPEGTVQVPVKPGANYDWQDGEWVYLTVVPTVDDYKMAIVSMLDGKAQERRYDSAVSISTYTGSTNPLWAAEASAFVAWRDNVWAYAYAELDKVMASLRPQPTVAELLSELPPFEW
ncbi:MAG: hypothetical protein LCH86_07755 [Proteobacteria bacterium]|nr:hypothetical protein [Pseudomonadota bacterium]